MAGKTEIKVFGATQDMLDYLDWEILEARGNADFFKADILMLPDGRWRLGIITDAQMELPLGD